MYHPRFARKRAILRLYLYSIAKFFILRKINYLNIYGSNGEPIDIRYSLTRKRFCVTIKSVMNVNEVIEEKLKKLPECPGVYQMKDKSGTIIYIGKAKVLKNRVRQYFHSSANHNQKTRLMVSHIADLDYIICDSEMEALVLESNLIKEYKPKYNILLKDDKHYPYIKLTLNEEYPRVLYVRRIENDGAKYFGPYPAGFSVRETLDLLKNIFKIAHCKKRFPRDIGKERPCIYYSMGRCIAPCTGKVTSEEYKRLFKDIASFMEGKDKEVIERLTEEMRSAAENLEFETAAALRDRLNSVKNLSERQKVITDNDADMDVFALAAEDGLACVEVFFIRHGKLIGRNSFDISNLAMENEGEAMESFVTQYYRGELYIPKTLLLSCETENLQMLERYFYELRGKKTEVKTPLRGANRRIVDMAMENARKNIMNMKTEKVKEQLKANAVIELAQALCLEVIPDRIESYDVSHISGKDSVSSMVVFKNGKPSKRDYRHFKLDENIGNNDAESMRRTLLRRFTHESRKGDGRFGELPDLILMDGGLGQAHVAMEVLEELNLDIPVFGMVKNDKHRSRGIVSDCGEITLPPQGSAFRLVTQIQDEVHRFAIEYHRKIRNKHMTESELDKIEGIGKVKKAELLKEFKSIGKIKSATAAELSRVRGISPALAEKIYNYFNKGDNSEHR